MTINVFGGSYVASMTINKSQSDHHTYSEDTNTCFIGEFAKEKDSKLIAKKCCSTKDKTSSKEDKKCCDDDCDCKCCHSIMIVNIQLPDNEEDITPFCFINTNLAKTIFGYQYLNGSEYLESLLHPPTLI